MEEEIQNQEPVLDEETVPEEEEEVIVESEIDLTPIINQQVILNEKMETLTLQLTEQNTVLQERLMSMYLFIMLLALLEVRKVFKGIISKVRVK